MSTVKSIQAIRSDNAPAPIGPYSQCIRAGNLLLTCGQIGLVPKTGEMKKGIDAEIEQVFSNLKGILDSAGAKFSDVTRVGVFLTDLGDFAKVNAAMEKIFTEPYPVRTTVQVSALPKGALVEIELTAFVG